MENQRDRLVRVDSDVGIGNAEICSVTANSSKFSSVRISKFWLILPEVTAIGVRLSHASREGSALGILLSNTWITCPREGDNPGKLGIIPYRLQLLECTVTESSGALGWICGRLGSCWGNGPTSQ